MLEDPVIDGERKESYIGRGSFGIVRLQLYRDMKVAVKEFLPRSLHEDVINEAHILASLSHPYLPVCLKHAPLRIVMQFHGTHGEPSTLFQELRFKKLKCSNLVFSFCAQLMEAIHYLHHDVEIFHNDITTTNILVENDHIILIDFGKAVKLSEVKMYHLGEVEKEEYISKYPHLAPEVVYGQQKQSVYSDIYATGHVFYKISDHSQISQALKISLRNLAGKCRALAFSSRPKSSEILQFLEGILI